MKRETVLTILKLLDRIYPNAGCALNYQTPFQLLIAVVLSAQTTDKSVNNVTPLLFEQYPDPSSLAAADQDDVAECIRRIGMYRTKSRNIISLSAKLVSDYGSEVPDDYESLVSLPGVGRKTANVVLAEAFGHQRIAVDTNVFRVSNRIGFTSEKDVLRTEMELMRTIPEEMWSHSHHLLIFHGRNLCQARNPHCSECAVSPYCRYFKEL
ncbi:MAG: endonuclease III [Anaerovoracaceae bacterium]|nr:endonuclease III [Anaerovoracaceae bacterium]